MTQTPETPITKVEQLEAALGRFAELTIQNTVRHDELLTSLGEKALAHDELLTSLGEKALAHDEALVAHDNTIDVLVANIQQLTENVSALSVNVSALSVNVSALSEQTNNNINNLAAQAAQDRQDAAIDRQRFDTRINQILEYLRDRNGGSSPPQ